MRILLVDDDPGLRVLLRTTFEAVDVEVEETDNAASAAAALERARPDVVVLDVRMPGMDGLELCRRIKDDPETAGIPVVLLTGSDGKRRRTATPRAPTRSFASRSAPWSSFRSSNASRAACTRSLSGRARRAASRSSSSSTRGISGTCSRSSAASGSCCRRPITRP